MGSCAETCTDDCDAGDAECVGLGARRVCADVDADDCLDWGPPTACPSGVCNAESATCAPDAPSCTDDCDPVEFLWTCASGGFTACVADGDADACFEPTTLACDQCGPGSPFESAQCLECCPSG